MKKQIIGLAAASLLAFSAQASDVPYSYAEIGISIIDLGPSLDGDAIKLKGSAALGDSVYAYGDYASYGYNDGFDFGWLGLGVGYAYEIAPNTDLNVDIGYRNADFHVGDESGYEIGVGIRSMISSNFELGARIESVDLDGSETFFEVNGAYYFNNNFSISAEASFADDIDFTGINLRYKF